MKHSDEIFQDQTIKCHPSNKYLKHDFFLQFFNLNYTKKKCDLYLAHVRNLSFFYFRFNLAVCYKICHTLISFQSTKWHQILSQANIHSRQARNEMHAGVTFFAFIYRDMSLLQNDNFTCLKKIRLMLISILSLWNGKGFSSCTAVDVRNNVKIVAMQLSLLQTVFRTEQTT